MALSNIIDPLTARTALIEWWARRNPGVTDVDVQDVDIPKANGMSSETVLFTVLSRDADTVQEREFAARVAPLGNGLFPSYDLAREDSVMRAVRASTGLPVPIAYGVETDHAVLGAPFLLMERCTGRVPGDDPPYTASGWVRDLTRSGQSMMYDNALSAMARISATDLRALDSAFVGGLGETPDCLSRIVGQCESYYEWVCASCQRHPVVERAFE